MKVCILVMLMMVAIAARSPVLVEVAHSEGWGMCMVTHGMRRRCGRVSRTEAAQATLRMGVGLMNPIPPWDIPRCADSTVAVTGCACVAMVNWREGSSVSVAPERVRSRCVCVSAPYCAACRLCLGSVLRITWLSTIAGRYDAVANR